MALLWLILKWCTILEDFFLLDSVRYCDNVMTTLKVWLVQYWDSDVRLISQVDTSSFTIYQQCHGDIESDVTPTLLQYQNVHWVRSMLQVYFKKYGPFLWIGFTCLNGPFLWIWLNWFNVPFWGIGFNCLVAAESLWGGELLLTTMYVILILISYWHWKDERLILMQLFKPPRGFDSGTCGLINQRPNH